MHDPTCARRTRSSLAALAALLFAATAGAATYKWVDANGRTVYSDQPPSGDVKAEIVGAAPPPANPDAARELANREAEFRKRQSDKAADAKKDDKARAEAQKLAAFCAEARLQVASLRRVDMVMYRLNDKGERVALDDAARRTEAERLEALIRERKCPPAQTPG